MKKTLMILVVCLSIFLVGCVNSDMTVDISKDGNINMSIKLLMNNYLSDKITDKEIENLKKEYKPNSIEKITEDGESGYLIKKSLGNIKDGLAIKEDAKNCGFVDVTEDKGFLFTTYDMTINLKNAILGEMYSEDQSMINLLGNSVNMNFHIISPYELLSSNANSTEKGKDGRTTYDWNYTLNNLGNINVKFKVPNILNIIIVGCGVFFIVAIIVIKVFFNRKRKDINEEDM